MRRRIFLSGGLTLAGLLTGCENRIPPLALAMCIDSTASAEEDRDRGIADIRTLLKGRHLSKGSHLTVIRSDCDPRPLWSGQYRRPDDLTAAVEEALTERVCGGSDPVGALDAALNWLTSPAQKSLPRKVLTGWLDCTPDPCKNLGRPRPFRPVETYLWPEARRYGVEVYLFGVPAVLHPRLRKAWSPHLAAEPWLFAPGHLIRAEDLKLRQAPLW